MNLNAYDNVIEKLDKTKTWVDLRKKSIFSREIKPRPYTCLLKRYNTKTNTNTYYIAMLDYPPKNKNYRRISCDNYGRIKINITPIWNETYLSQLESNCNVMCNLVESDDECDIYFIDV